MSLKQGFNVEQFLKSTLEKNVSIQRKQQNQTIWHWLLLVLFGLLAFGTLTQQLLFIGLFMILAAIVNGPLMILWGIIYSALVAFFPPLGLVISLVFFLINLGTVAKSWRLSLTSAYFYLVPLALSTLRHFWTTPPTYVFAIATGISLLGLHFLLEWLYNNNSLSRTITWRVICVPYSLLLLVIPNRFLHSKGLKKMPKRSRK